MKALLIVMLALSGASIGRAQAVVSESFKNSTTIDPNWVFAGSGYTPNLTSGVSDTAGDGWLRLTSTGSNQATSAYYNQAFTSANATVYAKFDFASYGGTGADGLTFFLFDGSKSFNVGAYGGSIGYAQKTVAGGGGANINGMNGGYLGVALDEYGNFSSASEGRVGGLGGTTGLVPDSIGVRGPGQDLNGYAFLGALSRTARFCSTIGIESSQAPTTMASFMKKIFSLQSPGKDDARVRDKIRHEVNKYVSRSRRQDLPEGFAVWEFACKVGAAPEDAQVMALKEVGGAIDRVAGTGATEVYVEIIALPGQRSFRV